MIMYVFRNMVLKYFIMMSFDQSWDKINKKIDKISFSFLSIWPYYIHLV